MAFKFIYKTETLQGFKTPGGLAKARTVGVTRGQPED